MDAIEKMQNAYRLRHKEYLTYEIIGEYISELYEPYKLIFTTEEDYKAYISTLPQYTTSDEWNETPRHSEFKNGVYKVIKGALLGSDENSIYSSIETKRKQLGEIRRLQYEKDKKGNCAKDLDFFQSIEIKIDGLFEDVLDSIYLQNKNNVYDYVRIGALFAQGLIWRDKGKYYFKNEDEIMCFDDRKYLDKFIGKLLVIKSVRQYVQDTINEVRGSKNNLYGCKDRMENIIEYCQLEELTITSNYQSKYDALE